MPILGGGAGRSAGVRRRARGLTLRGFAPATAEVTQRAATSLELSGETAEQMVQLLEALEGLDEVRDVYSNVEIADEVLANG